MTTNMAIAAAFPRMEVTEERNAAVGFAITLWMTAVDALGTHCSALGCPSDSHFLVTLTAWQERNSPYVNVALEYMADIEDFIRVS